MLSVRPRINELTFRVYSRSLHPELLETHATRVIQRDSYELTLGITSAGHLLHFRNRELQLVEVATSSHHDLPQQCELLHQKVKQPFNDHLFLDNRVSYRCMVRLETVEPRNLFAFNQIIDKADQAHSLIHKFDSNGRIAMGAMSYLTFESRLQNIRVRAIHSFPDTCQLLTCESTFEVK